MFKVLVEGIDQPVLRLFARPKRALADAGLSPHLLLDGLRVILWGVAAAAGVAWWRIDPASDLGPLFAVAGTVLSSWALVMAFGRPAWDAAGYEEALSNAADHARPFKVAIRITGLAILSVLVVAVLARGFGQMEWPAELVFLCVVARNALGDYVEAAEPPPPRA
jgi:hypothetical protein